MTPDEIAQGAKCFACIGDKESALIYLLTLWASGDCLTCAALSGDSSPVGAAVPQFVGQLYNQNNGQAFFYSTGLTNSDWTQIVSGGGTSGIEYGPNPNTLIELRGIRFRLDNTKTTFVFNGLEHITTTGIDISGSVFVSINLPDLIDLVGGLESSDAASLEEFLIPKLTSIDGGVFFNGCIALTAFSAPLLASIVGDLNFPNCSQLASFSAPVWLPTDGSTIDFSACALDAASVNSILARCVAAGVTTCTIDLSGGTSSAPTGQGLIDKADLITAGNNVNTN